MASTGKLDQTLRKISNASPPHPLAALHAVDDSQAKSNRGVCVCGEGGGENMSHCQRSKRNLEAVHECNEVLFQLGQLVADCASVIKIR